MLYLKKNKKMDSFEINKIIAAILMVALLVIGLGKLSNVIFNVEKPEIVGFKVEEEISSEKIETAEKSEEPQKVDIANLISLGNLEHGEKVFKKCTACHMIAVDGKNKIGPNLWGVIGRKAASISDYKYSEAMIAYGKKWSFEEMNSYLIKPQAYIKGTKMAFAGLRKEKDRASVIIYMNKQSNNPLPLP